MGYCSVIFYCTVYNSGSATCWGYVLGMKGWTTANISTPTGYWCAFNSVGSINPGQTVEVSCYGPGYVGNKVRKGTYLSITGYTDIYKSVAETNEYDNSKTQTIRIGY